MLLTTGACVRVWVGATCCATSARSTRRFHQLNPTIILFHGSPCLSWLNNPLSCVVSEATRIKSRRMIQGSQLVYNEKHACRICCASRLQVKYSLCECVCSSSLPYSVDSILVRVLICEYIHLWDFTYMDSALAGSVHDTGFQRDIKIDQCFVFVVTTLIYCWFLFVYVCECIHLWDMNSVLADSVHETGLQWDIKTVQCFVFAVAALICCWLIQAPWSWAIGAQWFMILFVFASHVVVAYVRHILLYTPDFCFKYRYCVPSVFLFYTP